MTILLFTGLIVGFAFGFVLQRGRFCMNSAFRDIITLQDFTLLKSVGAALLVALIGFTSLSAAGVITLNPKTFFWGAHIIGGFFFGVGMVLAGGCASGITYRIGEGMVAAFSAVLGLSIGGFITSASFLAPVKNWLQTSTKITLGDGVNLTLANVLGLDHTVLAFVIALIAILVWAYFMRKSGSDDTTRDWSWMSTGVAIGLISTISFPLSAAAGRNYPLGITAGWVANLKTLLPGVEGSPGWLGWMVIGMILGALVAAFSANELKFRMPSWKTLGQTFLGGFLMGFGAVTSGGCNIGHILSGVPQLALSSILGGTFIVLGGWAAAYYIFVRPMKA
jgi:uncharacterized membrane protein YedE/YeeE